MKIKRDDKPRMTLTEAQAKADELWHVYGGWAGTAELYDRPCRVGICESDGRFVHRVVLGMAHTFEAAFLMAEKTLARRLLPVVPKSKPAPDPRALPQEEMRF